MENILKAKAKVLCATCGCSMQRTKSIKVTAQNKTSAITEAQQKIEQWEKSLIGKNCKTCQSIINQSK